MITNRVGSGLRLIGFVFLVAVWCGNFVGIRCLIVNCQCGRNCLKLRQCLNCSALVNRTPMTFPMLNEFSMSKL